MPYHRFKVGQKVVAPPGVRDALIPRGPYVIIRLLPRSGTHRTTASRARRTGTSVRCSSLKFGQWHQSRR